MRDPAVSLPKRRMRTKLVLTVFFCAIIAADAWFMSVHIRGSLMDRMSFALAIVGLYGIVLGFIQRSSELKGFGGLVEGMTSPNLFEFIGANLQALGLLVLTASLGAGSRRTAGHKPVLGAAGSILFLVAAPIIVAYVVFHTFVIMPLAYVAYIFAEAVVERLSSSGLDTAVSARTGEHVETLNLRNVILADRVASKSYLVGLPSTFLSLALKLVSSFVM